jgi:hypothetical protein
MVGIFLGFSRWFARFDSWFTRLRLLNPSAGFTRQTSQTAELVRLCVCAFVFKFWTTTFMRFLKFECIAIQAFINDFGYSKSNGVEEIINENNV